VSEACFQPHPSPPSVVQALTCGSDPCGTSWQNPHPATTPPPKRASPHGGVCGSQHESAHRTCTGAAISCRTPAGKHWGLPPHSVRRVLRHPAPYGGASIKVAMCCTCTGQQWGGGLSSGSRTQPHGHRHGDCGLPSMGGRMRPRTRAQGTGPPHPNRSAASLPAVCTQVLVQLHLTTYSTCVQSMAPHAVPPRCLARAPANTRCSIAASPLTARRCTKHEPPRRAGQVIWSGACLCDSWLVCIPLGPVCRTGV
jgi:hypothetical protein